MIATKKTVQLLLIVFISINAFSQVNKNSKTFIEIKNVDSLLFEEGFNKCRLDIVENLISNNLEFYHDVGGIQNKEQFLKALKDNICPTNNNQKPIRKLVSETMEVFELKNNGILYGAIQNASHEFYIQQPNKELYVTGIAKFSHLWLLENNQWKLKTSFSFDHKATNE